MLHFLKEEDKPAEDEVLKILVYSLDFRCALVAMAKTEIIYPKNVGAQGASAPMAIEKNQNPGGHSGATS